MLTSTRLLIAVVLIGFITTGSYLVLSPSSEQSIRSADEEFERELERSSSNTISEVESQTSYSDSYILTQTEQEESSDEKQEGGEQESAPVVPPTSEQTTPPPPIPAPRKAGFTLADVAEHGDAKSCWTAVRGAVYDLTSFVSRHPGGEARILQICGKDGTALFEGQHGGDSKPESRLESLMIGPLID